ncbi:ABC transporter ATP-binding protein [Natronococcus sp. A-GB7]|uniref:ABC transporter ATP-binding protein n=1 Tax=Natronococcus sp. A-GB7 TaxID=3037649 RepID=UPI00241EF106|nr:ABC transporter ATP-binding protein [Natronococcus sp. A-GB7]MDG5817660.1 ABC transporter ATP-binding protein [Natronococcus sp. A-GB7]
MSETVTATSSDISKNDAILRTEGVTKKFGTLTAIDDVSIEIPAGEITSIIGPNGAGKTTLFNLLTGKHEPTEGRIEFRNESIGGLAPHAIVDRGIVRSFQITNFFADLSALENVRIATQAHYTGFSPGDFTRHHASLEEPIEDAREVLERVHLTDVAHQSAANLSYGQRRHLEIGIALAADPELLLMDEPTAGMSPEETHEVVDLIEAIAEDVTLVLIEHNTDIVMELSDQIAVLNEGELLSWGNPEEIKADERVQEAYLGGGGRE